MTISTNKVFFAALIPSVAETLVRSGHNSGNLGSAGIAEGIKISRNVLYVSAISTVAFTALAGLTSFTLPFSALALGSGVLLVFSVKKLYDCSGMWAGMINSNIAHQANQINQHRLQDQMNQIQRS